MKIDYFSADYAPEELKHLWLEKIEQVIDNGLFIGGTYVEKFEEEWANFTDSKFAIGVSNGLDGLILALRSLGLSRGDKVAVPAHTFIATWNAVLAVGASPIGVDVDEDGLLDLSKFEDIATDIDAVIPVHMHGASVYMEDLFRICNKPENKDVIKIIEDASQAHGACDQQKNRLGKFSDAVVYSMYPTKNLGALGDAGIVTTNQEGIANNIRILRSYGSQIGNKYQHEKLGFDNRLDSIQAAILPVNLPFLPKWNSNRQNLANLYLSELGDSLRFLQANREDSVRHHICVLHENRDELSKFLLENGIRTEIHYPNVAGKEADKFSGVVNSYPNAQRIAMRTISLPLSQWHDEDQISFVIVKLKEWLVN